MGFLNYNKIFDIDILNLETGCKKIRYDFDHVVQLYHKTDLSKSTLGKKNICLFKVPRPTLFCQPKKNAYPSPSYSIFVTRTVKVIIILAYSLYKIILPTYLPYFLYDRKIFCGRIMLWVCRVRRRCLQSVDKCLVGGIT